MPNMGPVVAKQGRAVSRLNRDLGKALKRLEALEKQVAELKQREELDLETLKADLFKQLSSSISRIPELIGN